MLTATTWRYTNCHTHSQHDALPIFILRIGDTCYGIEEKRLKTIVEPCGVSENIYTRSSGGIGLGLSITKALIEMHDGRLSLASRPGQGFEAQLIFPAHRAEQSAPDTGN